jgi:hypothetical protein
MRRLRFMDEFLRESAGDPGFEKVSVGDYWKLIESQGHETLTQRERVELNKFGQSLFNYFTVSRLVRYSHERRDYHYYKVHILVRRGGSPSLVAGSLYLTSDGWFMFGSDGPDGGPYKCDGFRSLLSLLRHIAGDENNKG